MLSPAIRRFLHRTMIRRPPVWVVEMKCECNEFAGCDRCQGTGWRPLRIGVLTRDFLLENDQIFTATDCWGALVERLTLH
jgi:hypothetical protein